jgi:iron complex outermembrane receptor protein
VYAFYAKEPVTVTANYSWLSATEVVPESGVRRAVSLTPRHSAGLDVAWEEDESGTRAGVEVFYTGRQSLDHDPYRTTSAPYATIGVLVSQRVGRAMLYLNLENLADVRQTDHEPMLLPRPTPDGRLTVDSWAPAEGRMLNGGVKIGF